MSIGSFALAVLSMTAQTTDLPLVQGRPVEGSMSVAGFELDDCFVLDKAEAGPLSVAVRSDGFPVQLTVLRRDQCEDDSRWGTPGPRWRSPEGAQADEARVEIIRADPGRYVVQVRRRLYTTGVGPYVVLAADALDAPTPTLRGGRTVALAASSPPRSPISQTSLAPGSTQPGVTHSSVTQASVMPPAPTGPVVARRQLSMGDPVTGAIGAGGATSADCYYVTTTNRYAPRFETIVRAEAFDAVVGVGEGRDCSAPVIWSNDNGGAETGGPTDARLEVTPNRPGDYFIRVERRGTGVGNYRVMAIVDGIFTVGAGLNSPMAQRHRTTMAAAREAARTEVASLTYAPPPRPANWTGLSDGDVYEVIDRKFDVDPESLTAQERTWVRYHNELIIKQYLAGVPTWSSQNPSTEVLRARAAAAASNPASIQAPQPGTSQAQAMEELGQIPSVAPPGVIDAIRMWNENIIKVRGRTVTYEYVRDTIGARTALTNDGYFEACDRLGRAASVLGGNYRRYSDANCLTLSAIRALERAQDAEVWALRRQEQADRAAQQQAAQDRRWAEAAQSNAMRQAFLNPEVTVWSTDSSGRRTSQTMRYQDYQRRYVH